MDADHEVLEDFRSEAADADVIIVYYAGHGMQLDGRDVIAPVDLEYECPTGGEAGKHRRSLPLDELFGRIGSDKAKIIYFIDACRNTPFARCPKRGAPEGSGLTFRGLGRTGTANRSMVIVNATSPGGLTEDGLAGKHSPFAGALIERLRLHPEALVAEIIDKTADDVGEATNGLQVPERVTRGSSPRFCLAAKGCRTASLDNSAVADADKGRLLAERKSQEAERLRDEAADRHRAEVQEESRKRERAERDAETADARRLKAEKEAEAAVERFEKAEREADEARERLKTSEKDAEAGRGKSSEGVEADEDRHQAMADGR